ncbi:LysE family translocator [Bartonella sp. HY406]|uniref:LysE family translocator n=1 Tax=Bartonella sp. HY406 TaxID=2979331 RepID=UPI0021C99D60|nr:LysE family translocator [Bartonella sp. HY406]UXN04727.1 LysE family translocator [Bartonella sp. HY406]
MTFLPEWSIFLKFALYSIILTLVPGPDLTLLISRSILDGAKAGFACLLGAYSGIFIHVIAVSIGLSALIIASPTAFFILKWLGAAYLVWLAIQLFRNRSTFKLDMEKTKTFSFKKNYLAGLMSNLLNPKVILFNMTFLPQFVSVTDPHAAGKLVFLGLSFIPVSMPFVAAIIVAADRVAKLLKENPQFIRGLNWVMGAMFMGFAVKLLAIQAK